MKQLKKTILTLVALLAVTTGAWADEKMVTINLSTMSSGAVTATGFKTILENIYVGPDPATITTSEGVITKLVIKKGSLYANNFTEDNVGVTPGTITYGSDEITVTDINAESVTLSRKGSKNWSPSSVDVYYASASSSFKVAWTAASNTGSFTMPGGNVTLEPEYYPQATLAFQGLTATVDAAAKTEAPLAVLADGAVTGGTLMYYVATDKNFSQADAIALAETQWSAAIPTAETIEAAGTYIMWYYIKGDAEHSDTDPVPLAVTLLPEPTYAVTFAEGTPETDKWTASPNTGVTKGQTVNVTYTGSKKVIGVKAEKKEAAPASLIVNPVVGQVIGSDGKNYAYGSLPTGVTAVAKICYVSGSNGLALALTDEEGTMNWSTAQTTCAAHTPAITGGTWKLATKDEWSNMITAAGSHTALRDGFSSVGGTNMKEDYPYWSSTEDGSDKVWSYFFGYGVWGKNNSSVGYVRACLAF